MGWHLEAVIHSVKDPAPGGGPSTGAQSRQEVKGAGEADTGFEAGMVLLSPYSTTRAEMGLPNYVQSAMEND